MNSEEILGGTCHELPEDMRVALAAEPEAITKWNKLTPLARNEWICWTTFVKQADTRAEHVSRAVRQVKEGKKRPCCWIGCIHRTDKPISPSVKGILEKQGYKF